MKKILFAIGIIFACTFSWEMSVYADETTTIIKKIPVSNGGILPGPAENIKNGDGSIRQANTDDVKKHITQTFLPGITNWLLVLITMVAVIVIIVGGLTYLISAGDQEKAKKGRDTIIWGIIGVIVAILSYAIVRFVIEINFF